MPRAAPNSPCPCGSGSKYKKCCRRLHQGQPAPTAEALMRSRYCAYALGLVDYVADTTHPASPHAQPERRAWLADLQRFCAATTFERLEVTAHEPGPHRAWVTFTAHLRQDGRPVPMTERSRFIRAGERWLYLDADSLPQQTHAR